MTPQDSRLPPRLNSRGAGMSARVETSARRPRWTTEAPRVPPGTAPARRPRRRSRLGRPGSAEL